MAIRYVDNDDTSPAPIRVAPKEKSQPVKKVGKRTASFDRNQYQRDYMRARRAKAKV